ncbi:MAG: aspartate--tRNA ligase [Elusimicrobiaceae bacterium]|nr:aspartate--tRNA ligase [Elusimicrobiaceae bacterium]
MKRTHYCGHLRTEHTGSEVVLCGWVHSARNHGGVLFIDLRDRTGMAQAVVEPENKALFETASQLRGEFVAEITGTVRPRPGGYQNGQMTTGAIEVAASAIVILNESKTPPFELGGHAGVNEETRLKYRYVDLRRQKMAHNIIARHQIAQIIRGYMNRNDFLEVETPIMTRSTPEGARDYLVPSRLKAGDFYALPQSPQMFKQILMVSGIDRYYQLARAFRDEDLRADRQPEFTQLDLEMSFAKEEDVFSLAEGLLKELFCKMGQPLDIPFPRMTFRQVMERYGSDKPDLRFGLEIENCTEIFRETGFKVFADIVAADGAIRAIRAPGGAVFTRGDMDRLTETAKKAGAKGLVWLRVKGGQFESPSAKFFTPEELRALETKLSAADGDALFIASDLNPLKAATVLGELRKELIAKLQLKPRAPWFALWVTNFPLLEWVPEENRYEATHNPFTAPLDAELPMLDTEPLKMGSHQYDLVLNGVELASGSVRNHRSAIQRKLLGMMGHSPESISERFGMLVNSLDYGAPPHAGLGLGFDRLVALLCGETSIREVMAFPKTTTAACLLSGAPGRVSQTQLDELHLKVVEPRTDS